MPATTTPDATQLRTRAVDQLVQDGAITSPEIAAAMREVPRHLFVPASTSLELAYDPYRPVITKTGSNGVHLSSVSAPQIHALMLEQAKVRPGMRVLEIGSGGLNAAYLAQLVGDTGDVVTVDIAPDVTDCAERLLAGHGYGGRVRAVCADAGDTTAIRHLGPFDIVMVTAGAWDIPPAWTDVLAPDGRLIVPLRMRGLTRSVAFRHVDEQHLESESTFVCGFVPMQGVTARQTTIRRLRGAPVSLRFDDGLPEGFVTPATNTERAEAWTGITSARREQYDLLHFYLATVLPGHCLMTASTNSRGIPPAAAPGITAVVHGRRLAYLVTRSTPHFEYGVQALGPGAEQLAEAVAKHMQVWQTKHRNGPGPTVRVYPADTPDHQIAANRIIDKEHRRIAVSW